MAFEEDATTTTTTTSTTTTSTSTTTINPDMAAGIFFLLVLLLILVCVCVCVCCVLFHSFLAESLVVFFLRVSFLFLLFLGPRLFLPPAVTTTFHTDNVQRTIHAAHPCFVHEMLFLSLSHGLRMKRITGIADTGRPENNKKTNKCIYLYKFPAFIRSYSTPITSLGCLCYDIATKSAQVRQNMALAECVHIAYCRRDNKRERMEKGWKEDSSLSACKSHLYTPIWTWLKREKNR